MNPSLAPAADPNRRATPGTVARSTLPGRDNAGPDLLSAYLDDAGKVPLLTAEQEVELGRHLSRSRKALARLARRLHRCSNDRGLVGTVSRPRRGQEWTLAEVDHFYDRLVQFDRTGNDSRTRRIVEEARVQKRRLDRARERLIVANLRLVVHVARKYENNGVPLLDLIQEGNLGLMRAVEKFRHDRQNRFSTYAYWWIRQAVERSIGNDARTVRLPIHMMEKIQTIRRVADALQRRLGRRPRRDEIAEASGVCEGRVEEILSYGRTTRQLEARVGGVPLLSTIRDSRTSSPFKKAMARELRERVEYSLRRLDPREEHVVRLRYGIGMPPLQTLEDVGARLGLSRERARQIESKALAKIRSGPACRALREYVQLQSGRKEP